MTDFDFCYYTSLLREKRYDLFCARLSTLGKEEFFKQDESGRTLIHLLTEVPEDTPLHNVALQCISASAFTVADAQGDTPLHLLVAKNYVASVVIVLPRIQYAKVLRSKNNDGDNVFHIAARHQSVTMLNTLLYYLQYTNTVAVQNIKGNTPLFEAVVYHNVPAINALKVALRCKETAHIDFFKKNILEFAVATNKPDVVEAVLNLYYDKVYDPWDKCILTTDNFGEESVVSSAMQSNCPEGVKAVVKFYIDNPHRATISVLQHLIYWDGGGHPTLLRIRGTNGKSFYHLIAEIGYTPALRHLNRSHPLDCKTKEDYNILHSLALSPTPNEEFLEAMRTKVGDTVFVKLLDERCLNGYTPIQYLRGNFSEEEAARCLAYLEKCMPTLSDTGVLPY